MTKKDKFFFPNVNSFSYYRSFRDYTLYISQIPYYKGIIQIRDRDGTRFLGYCSVDTLDQKIKALDTLFTFYS